MKVSCLPNIRVFTALKKNDAALCTTYAKVSKHLECVWKINNFVIFLTLWFFPFFPLHKAVYQGLIRLCIR